MKNPWSKRWIDLGAGEDPAERRAVTMEARQSEAEPTFPCNHPGCKGTLYHRPGVGGWWCDTCLQLELKNYYVHPISMSEVYVDDQPTRRPEFALSPTPDTIGPFVGSEPLKNFLLEKKLSRIRV